jgi:hypothetical protein
MNIRNVRDGLQDIQKWLHSLHKDFLIYSWIASVPRGS